MDLSKIKNMDINVLKSALEKNGLNTRGNKYKIMEEMVFEQNVLYKSIF